MFISSNKLLNYGLYLYYQLVVGVYEEVNSNLVFPGSWLFSAMFLYDEEQSKTVH